MTSRAEIYVGVELYDFLNDRVDELERKNDTKFTFREAIVASLSPDERKRFEEQYVKSTEDKYGRMS